MVTDRTGQQLGNYTLLRLLGRGGFAEVYLGQHRYLKTQVAIKILHGQLAEQEMNDFLREAQIIARLNHPHIIRIQDFGVEQGMPYLAMPYAPNGTLRQQYPKGIRLAPETIAPLVRQVASALQYAHEQRLIHRDIKPENMLLDERGDVLLSDFGIATAAMSSRYQSTQEVVGTIAYMAPEQLQGHPRPASDQYSLAVVVYEWLTGARPFQGSVSEVIAMHLSAPVPALREQVPSLSPALEQVIFTALAKTPRERFPSVAAFAEAFEDACLGTASMPVALADHFAPTERVAPSAPLEPTHYLVTPTPAGQWASLEPGSATRPARPSASLEAPTLPESLSSRPPLLAPSPGNQEVAGARRKRLLMRGLLAALVVLVIGTASTAGLLRILGSKQQPTTQAVTHSGPTATPTGPALASNSAIYLASGSSLMAIKASNGSLLWRSPIDSELSEPVLYAGIVYLGGATLSAYRASDGRLLWQTSPDTGDGFQWLAASQGMLFAATFHGKVAALRAFDGSQVWEYQTDAPQISALQVKNGRVFVATYNYSSSVSVRSILALSPLDGSVRWKTSLNGFFPPRMVAGNSALYVLLDTNLYALDLFGGSVLWSYTSPDPVNVAAEDGGALYVGAGGALYALRISDRGVLWKYTPPGYSETGPNNYFNNSFPVVVNNVIYLGSDDNAVYAIDANSGQQLWRTPTGDSVDSTPAVFNGVVYVTSHDYFLYALDATSGGQRWRYQTGSNAISSPVVGP